MKTSVAGKTKVLPPWEPCPVEPADITAIRALRDGKATPDQQHRFVEWLSRATGIGELEFRPAGERESNFASGKRFVGMQFFQLAKTFLKDPKQG